MLFKSVKQSLAKSAVGKGLAFNLTAARAHEANKVPPGHQAYQLLYQDSYKLLEEYAGKFMLPELDEEVLRDGKKVKVTAGDLKTAKAEAMATLFSHYPAMGVLQARTKAPAVAKKAATKPSPVLMFVMVVIGAPVVWGTMNGIYHVVSHWFGA